MRNTASIAGHSALASTLNFFWLCFTACFASQLPLTLGFGDHQAVYPCLDFCTRLGLQLECHALLPACLASILQGKLCLCCNQAVANRPRL